MGHNVLCVEWMGIVESENLNYFKKYNWTLKTQWFLF